MPTKAGVLDLLMSIQPFILMYEVTLSYHYKIEVNLI